MKSEATRRLGAIVNIAFCIVFGIAVLYVCVNAKVLHSFRTLQFVSTSGIVHSASLAHQHNGPIQVSRPVIEYSYVVNDVTYRNNTFDSLDRFERERSARHTIQQYPKGGSCNVYYDAANPKDSVLSRSQELVTVTYVALIIFCMLAATGINLMIIIRKRKSTGETSA